MILAAIALAILFLGVTWDANAQEARPPLSAGEIVEAPLPPGLQLKTLVEEALEKNPEIVAARKKWEAAAQKISQASSYPDPTLSYGYFGRRVETRVGPQRNRLTLSQKFPFFGKLSLKGEIASKAADETRELYEAKKLGIISRVKSAYYRLFLAHKAIQINEENTDIVRRFARIAEVKYATGKVSQQDVLKAQVELSKFANELITLKQEKETAEASINTLLDRPPEEPLGIPAEVQKTPLRFSVAKLREIALERSPLLKAAQTAIERSRAALDLAKRNYYPDFTVGLNYIEVKGGTTRSSDDGKDALLFTVGINIPIWTGSLRAGVDEAVADIGAASSVFRTRRNGIVFEVEDLFVKVDTAARLVDLFKTTLIPLAEQSLEAATAGYQTEKVDFLNLLDSQRKLQDFQLDYFRALVSYQQRLTDLERVVGVDLVAP